MDFAALLILYQQLLELGIAAAAGIVICARRSGDEADGAVVFLDRE